MREQGGRYAPGSVESTFPSVLWLIYTRLLVLLIQKACNARFACLTMRAA